MLEGRWRLESLRALSTDMYIWVTRGQGRLRINGASRGFAAHSLIFLPAGIVHAFDISKNAQGFVLFAQPEPHPLEPAMIKAQSIFDQGQITAYFENLNKETGNGSIGTARAVDSYVALIAVWIERHQDRSDIHQGKDNGTAAMRLVAGFLADLEQNFHHQRSIDTYSARLSVTATHLTRVCQQICRQSASELLHARTAFQARILLADSPSKIKTISQDLGFTSAAYFSRFFARQTGQSPKIFRQQSQGTKRPNIRPSRA